MSNSSKGIKACPAGAFCSHIFLTRPVLSLMEMQSGQRKVKHVMYKDTKTQHNQSQLHLSCSVYHPVYLLIFWGLARQYSCPRFNQSLRKPDKTTQPTRDIYPLLDQCWATVNDAGPTLVQHWVDVSCLLGMIKARDPPLFVR